MEKLELDTKLNWSKSVNKGGNKKCIINYINFIILPSLIFFIWIIVTKLEVFSPVILPSLTSVFESFKLQIVSGQLLKDIGISLLRVIE